MPEPFKPSLKPFTDSDYSPAPPAAPALPVPGFWLRAGAFAVDVGLLSMIFSFVGRNAYEALYPARTITQPLAAFVVFLYFLIGSSSLTGGQTAGKALFKLRTLSLAGDRIEVNWAAAAKRALLVQLHVLAYLIAIFPVFSVICGVLLGARLPLTFLSFPVSDAGWLGMITLGIAAACFAFCNAVFCGLHPKRTGFHDLWSQTAVVRKGEEAAALAFFAEWDDVDRTRLKLAKWPAGALALVFLTLAILVWVSVLPGRAKVQAPALQARELLKNEDFELLGVFGPSLEDAERFDRGLRAENETRAAKGLDPITTESMRLAWTGRKVHFLFVDKAILTSESLVNSPTYAEMVENLPALARELSAEFFLDKEGNPAPYTGIQVDFLETLPLYLYSRSRHVWAEALPVTESEGVAWPSRP